MDITWRVVNRGVEGERGGKVQRISSIDDRWKIDKNSVGNAEAKELISMTHGHEL